MSSLYCKANSEPLTFLATVDELSGVDTLSSDEELCPLLETVWVTEGNLGQGGATAGVVDDILKGQPRSECHAQTPTWRDCDQFMLQAAYLHDPLDVTMAFSEVNTTEFRSTLPVLDVGFEHGARTFSLSPDHTSHGVLKQTTAGVSHRLDMWTHVYTSTRLCPLILTCACSFQCVNRHSYQLNKYMLVV